MASALLLLPPPDLVIEGVVDGDLATALDGEAPRLRKNRVARIVLAPARAGVSELRGPPGVAETAEPAPDAGGGRLKDLLGAEQRRQLRAQTSHGGLKAMI